MEQSIEEIKDRIAGCLWGQAIGDALGLGTEFMSRMEVMNCYPEGIERYEQIICDRHRSNWKTGEWTDDTEMMLCIARAIIKDKAINPQTVAHNFKEWFKDIPRGIGRLTYTVLCLSDYEEYPEKAAETVWDMYGRKNAANGGVMRTSVVGLWPEDVAENAERICRLTHADPRCIGSCVIISELINSLVWHGKELSCGELLQIGDKYDGRIKPYLDMAHNGLLEDFELDDETTMGYTLKTMGCAIWCLCNVDNFKDGLLKIVNAGGDADTNAAVTCAVLGAKYGKNGIPEHYIQDIRRKDEYEEMIDRLADILNERSKRKQ